jgi:hypothetical protein
MTDHSDSQLDDFAQLLQQAHPEPLISDDFEKQLFIRLESSPPLRNVFQQSRFMRVAASLLLISILGVPAAAFMGILPGTSQKPPVLLFMPAPSIDDLNVDLSAVDPEVVVIPPADEYINDPLYQQRVTALSQRNSFRLLIQLLPDEIEASILDFISKINKLLQIVD